MQLTRSESSVLDQENLNPSKKAKTLHPTDLNTCYIDSNVMDNEMTSQMDAFVENEIVYTKSDISNEQVNSTPDYSMNSRVPLNEINTNVENLLNAYCQNDAQLRELSSIDSDSLVSFFENEKLIPSLEGIIFNFC